MMTHGPPYANLDRTVRGDLVGCPHLLRAVMRARPLVHCFGHIHEAHGAQRIVWGPGVEAAARNPSTTIKEFRKSWADEIAADGITALARCPKVARTERCARVDVSAETGSRPIQRGRETLLVNAAVMDERNRPVNAPWLVVLDLPRASRTETETVTETETA